ncbi:MAG: hypothetical protein KDB18_11695 [Salinibacterium sp.]|nr:hypothetical protein [Salinibacterium sp.]
MGLDPLGLEDEYAEFSGVEWSQVHPRNFRTAGYDISPAIGFRLHPSPHMWNYYLPGFMTASLLHDAEHDVSEGFMWQMRQIHLGSRSHAPRLPWWGGLAFARNFTPEQDDGVVKYLQYMRDCGHGEPHGYDWQPADDHTIQRWLTRG